MNAACRHLAKAKGLLAPRTAGERLLRLFLVLLAGCAVTFFGHRHLKWYTGSWDGASEMLAVGRATQIQLGQPGAGGLLGAYSQGPEEPDTLGYDRFRDLPPLEAATYVSYTHQSGLQGTAEGLLARALLLAGVAGNARLNALYFVTSALFYALAASLSLSLAQRFGPGAGLFAFAAVLCAPWLTTGAKNLYWVLWTWLLPLAAAVPLVRELRQAGTARLLRWAAVPAAVFVRCACGFEYISVFLILAEIPAAAWLAEALAAGDGKQAKKSLVSAVKLGLAALAGVALALGVWLVQSRLYYGSWALALGDISFVAAQRSGLTEVAGDMASELAAATPFWGAVQHFAAQGTPLVQWGAAVLTLPWLLAAAAGAAVLAFAFGPGRRSRLAGLGGAWLLGAAAPVSWMILAKGHALVHGHLTPMLWQFALTPLSAAMAGAAAEAAVRALARWGRKEGEQG